MPKQAAATQRVVSASTQALLVKFSPKRISQSQRRVFFQRALSNVRQCMNSLIATCNEYASSPRQMGALTPQRARGRTP